MTLSLPNAKHKVQYIILSVPSDRSITQLGRFSFSHELKLSTFQKKSNANKEIKAQYPRETKVQKQKFNSSDKPLFMSSLRNAANNQRRNTFLLSPNRDLQCDSSFAAVRHLDLGNYSPTGDGLAKEFQIVS